MLNILDWDNNIWSSYFLADFLNLDMCDPEVFLIWKKYRPKIPQIWTIIYI